ncbi:MAG: radical SAM protein [Bacillota bacterium]|nr:radical SAM protein [Bacillota bacterium]
MSLEAVSVYNVLPLTSTCNLNCIFCSHLQNPPGIRAYHFPPLPVDELKQLIPFLDGSRKIIIGESSTRLSEGEPLTHPRLLSVIGEIRRYYPDTPLQITTNGALLNRDLLQNLQSLSEGQNEGQHSFPHKEPKLELVISLNSSSRHWRSEVMGDKSPWIALEAVKLCRELGIPFHGSIVALPHIYGWDSLKETLFFLKKWLPLRHVFFCLVIPAFLPSGPISENPLWENYLNFCRG